MIKVLHLTAHLGGGVGKALSGLVVQAASSGSDIVHTIVTLEEQEKPQFIESARNCGCEVVVCPCDEHLRELIEAADIVQLEWWNHPATIRALCGPLPPMRLLVWSHVSGLYNPIIPPGLIQAAQRFLFTSPCSYEAREVSSLLPGIKDKTGVVSSSGGFDGFPPPAEEPGDILRAGYIGSLNFAKLHPRYVEFLSAVKLSGFGVKLIGDETNREILEQQCIEAGKPGMLEFRGYTSDVASELAQINVLAYLLNPQHYGTTENALIEAMAMGIVPIVLNNPAERHIIEDGKTGLIVGSPGEFGEAVRWLSENTDERRTLGMQAARSVRERFTARKMETSLNSHYESLVSSGKRDICFTDIFGTGPAQWFLSCQGCPATFTTPGGFDTCRDEFSVYGLLEKSKGTVFHFRKHFPNDLRLEQWSQKLMSLK